MSTFTTVIIMDAPRTQAWPSDKVNAWAWEWLTLYAQCDASGSHGKKCKCKTGPPKGVLVAIVEKL